MLRFIPVMQLFLSSAGILQFGTPTIILILLRSQNQFNEVLSPCRILLLASLAVPAFAGVTVSSPSNGGTVSSPVNYVASSTTSCSKGVASMGVYVDNQLQTVVMATR